jgi:hypothetical protein
MKGYKTLYENQQSSPTCPDRELCLLLFFIYITYCAKYAVRMSAVFLPYCKRTCAYLGSG